MKTWNFPSHTKLKWSKIQKWNCIKGIYVTEWNGQLPLARLNVVVPVWDVDKELRSEDVELLLVTVKESRRSQVRSTQIQVKTHNK